MFKKKFPIEKFIILFILLLMIAIFMRPHHVLSDDLSDEEKIESQESSVDNVETVDSEEVEEVVESEEDSTTESTEDIDIVYFIYLDLTSPYQNQAVKEFTEVPIYAIIPEEFESVEYVLEWESTPDCGTTIYKLSDTNNCIIIVATKENINYMYRCRLVYKIQQVEESQSD